MSLIISAMKRNQPGAAAPKGVIPPALAKAAAVAHPVFLNLPGFSTTLPGKRGSCPEETLQIKRPKPAEENKTPEKQPEKKTILDAEQIAEKKSENDGGQSVCEPNSKSLNHHFPIGQNLQFAQLARMMSQTLPAERLEVAQSLHNQRSPQSENLTETQHSVELPIQGSEVNVNTSGRHKAILPYGVLECNLVHGRKEGEALETFPDGETIKFTYRNDVREGEALQTFPDGRTRKLSYRNGKPSGYIITRVFGSAEMAEIRKNRKLLG